MALTLRPEGIIRRLNGVILDISMVNVANFDLNLLRVLEALFLERSVSRAATRLKLSQPAVSSALMRLRRELEDPLFVRSRDGMLPTERARSMQAGVTQALAQLRSSLEQPAPFDPRTAKQTFVIAASDHAQLLFVPALMQRLLAFPGLTVRVVALPRDFPLRELEAGELDLVVGAFDLAPGDRAPRGLKRQVLCRESYVVVGRKGHPALRSGKFDLDAPQMHVSPRGGTEGRFERRSRLRRNIVLFTPHYLVMPWVLASSDVLAAVPEQIGRRFCEVFPLKAVPVKVEHQRLEVVQLWHPQRQSDSAHRWLRESVARWA